jgi:hypothetical protein
VEVGSECKAGPHLSQGAEARDGVRAELGAGGGASGGVGAGEAGAGAGVGLGGPSASAVSVRDQLSIVLDEPVGADGIGSRVGASAGATATAAAAAWSGNDGLTASATRSIGVVHVSAFVRDLEPSTHVDILKTHFAQVGAGLGECRMCVSPVYV